MISLYSVFPLHLEINKALTPSYHPLFTEPSLRWNYITLHYCHSHTSQLIADSPVNCLVPALGQKLYGSKELSRLGHCYYACLEQCLALRFSRNIR